jgi:hypothetical protein
MFAQLSQDRCRFINLDGLLMTQHLEQEEVRYCASNERCIVSVGCIEVPAVEDPHGILSVIW